MMSMLSASADGETFRPDKGQISEDDVAPEQRVTIATGPFGGMTGTVVQWVGSDRALVRLDDLIKGVGVEVDRRSLTRGDPAI